MTDAALSAFILGLALILFVSDRLRHDLVALLALLACIATGLVGPTEALQGFAAPAVITVAAVLIVGRAVELSGVAAVVTRRIIPEGAPFPIQLGAVLVLGAMLSAFMNNIAALVLTMPIAVQVARRSNNSPALVLLPLSYATILGGMTTLIGTPANLILSNIREDALGAPFGFFAMTPVGVTVTIAGLAFLIAFGWRMIPADRKGKARTRDPWQVFELAIPEGRINERPASLAHDVVLAARARTLALVRGHRALPIASVDSFVPGDRLLLVSRSGPTAVASATGLIRVYEPSTADDAVSARVIVANGSILIGRAYQAMEEWSEGDVQVVAAGPRAARTRLPLSAMLIQPGDQLFLSGSAAALGQLVKRARLLELDRLDTVSVPASRALGIAAIYGLAILASIFAGVPIAISFLAAAVAMVLFKLLPGEETYRSIDWSIIVLLAAMIPVGRSFEESGAATLVATWLGDALATSPLFVVLAALCGVTMLLSIFLNNVATAVVMGAIGLNLAELLGVDPDAALLAVLIGASSDFLTPIGHHNNTLVMSAGGYRFADYGRVGAPLVIIVVLLTAAFLTGAYG
ncbi:SLC13 family permease [Allosphingosinicella humi]